MALKLLMARQQRKSLEQKSVPVDKYPLWPELSRPVINFCYTHKITVTPVIKKLIQDQDDSLFSFDTLLAHLKSWKPNNIWFFEDIDKLIRQMRIVPTRD